ncbi:MAG: hypothetical protein QXT06_05700, partial [Candidatus Bathyarchaeia archaeon]
TLWKHRNVLLKQKFNIRFVLAVYDMIFMDVILLFIRLAWLMYIIFFFHQNFIYILILITIIYLAIELMMVTTAVLLSPRKQDLKNIYLAPIVAFIYRPFYSLIRFKAYFDWLLKRKSRW